MVICGGEEVCSYQMHGLGRLQEVRAGAGGLGRLQGMEQGGNGQDKYGEQQTEVRSCMHVGRRRAAGRQGVWGGGQQACMHTSPTLPGSGSCDNACRRSGMPLSNKGNTVSPK